MDEAVLVTEERPYEGSRRLGSKYVLGERLGCGAMGVVHDATTDGHEVLAVKLLRPELSNDERTVAQFVQEQQIFSRIDHPNVVQVHDLVAEGDQLGIVMERVDGGDLRQRVNDRSLTPTAAMQIAVAIAAGLEAIHAGGVVHRDLKPANILISEGSDGSLQPKISDFGIARMAGEVMTHTSTTIGTPLYMAPEAADKRGDGAPSDVYSLGAVLFEMLIGTAPFHEGGTFAILRAHAIEAPPSIAGVPVQLADLIDEMLAKDPAQRPSATSVRQRLLGILPQIDDSEPPVAVARVLDDETLAANWAAVAAIEEIVTGLGVDSAETLIPSPLGSGEPGGGGEPRHGSGTAQSGGRTGFLADQRPWQRVVGLAVLASSIIALTAIALATLSGDEDGTTGTRDGSTPIVIGEARSGEDVTGSDLGQDSASAGNSGSGQRSRFASSVAGDGESIGSATTSASTSAPTTATTSAPTTATTSPQGIPTTAPTTATTEESTATTEASTTTTEASTTSIAEETTTTTETGTTSTADETTTTTETGTGTGPPGPAPRPLAST